MTTQPTEEVVFNQSLDQLCESLPIGSITRSIGNNLYGINFTQTGSAVPRSKDSWGLTFFTRPQLNLTTLNVSNYRGFYNLLTSEQLSYQRYTRLMLDPRLGYSDNGLKCPFVDPFNPFIPILTNNLVSISGWPDLTAPTYTSESGLYGEEISFVDGVTNHFESFDVDATFKNTRGNPLLYFFYTWIKYSTLVFEGILNPYLDMITENEIDYNTRIYRLVMDSTKRYVTYIGYTGASFPLNVPTGNLFDYNTDSPFNTKNSEINIRFRSMGFLAFEDFMKYEFNNCVSIFNPEIRKIFKHDLSGRLDHSVLREDGTVAYQVPGCNYVKIPHYLLASADSGNMDYPFYNLNYRAYPYINLHTNELEWFCSSKHFKTLQTP